MTDLVNVDGPRRVSSAMWAVLSVELALLGCLSVFPSFSRAEDKTPAWWEAETAMGPDGQLSLKSRPWWNRAAELRVGEQFALQSDKPGGGMMLVRRERFTRNGKPQEAIVWVLDDDGDMRPGDKDGDKDSDCYVADYDADGVVDRLVDYIDNNGDGKHDEMDIRYFDKGRLRRAWFGVDLDGDGHTWNVTHYEYAGGDYFNGDPYGDNMIYFNGYDAQRNAWFPASECPFSFHDADGDGQTEAVVRVSAVPLAFDLNEHPDGANDIAYSSSPRTDQTRAMGAVNVRYSVDIDGGSDKERRLHCDLGFNLIGRLPYKFDGMERTNPLRREPKTTICIPHASVRAMAESYPADQTGFSWREQSDDSICIGHGPHADEDRRWEGVFWTWGRRPMHNTGGPCQAWNMRREFQPTPSTQRVLYYSRVDRRIHLKGATEGWIQIGHMGDKRPWGEIRYFDTNKDGYFDRWEVHRDGQATPVRVSTAIDAGVRELPADWAKLTELYTKELLPEARRANQQLMAAMHRVDPTFVAPEALTKALVVAPSESEKRYVEDILREEQYLALRERLLARSEAWLAKDSAPERILSMAPDRSAASAAAWQFAQRIARLDAAYGEGRYDEAVTLLECGDLSPLSSGASAGLPSSATGVTGRLPLGCHCWLAQQCFYAVSVICTAGQASSGTLAHSTRTWKVGTARAVITPKTPFWMGGFGSRTRPAEGAMHDLWVKALALEDAEGRVGVVLTGDILGVPKGVYDNVCRRLKESHGLERRQIMLSASHNHSGPALRNMLQDCYPIDDRQRTLIDEYTTFLEGTMVETIAAALRDRTPATLWAGQGAAGFAVNRVANNEGELPELLRRGDKPKGPSDFAVPVLVARKPDGKPLAVLCGYAAHMSSLYLDAYQYSGDYAGFTQIALEKAYPGAQAMFFQGCGGNQSAAPRGTLARCQAMGRELAEGVQKVVDTPMTPLTPRLETAFEFVKLDFETPSRDYLEKTASKAGYEGRWAKRLLAQLDRGEAFATAYPEYPVEVWRLGGHQLWIALGGEVSVEYALGFKEKYGPTTWTAGYTNDVMAYIPSRAVWEANVYQSGAFPVYGLPAVRWKPDIENRIVGCVDRLVEKTK